MPRFLRAFVVCTVLCFSGSAFATQITLVEQSTVHTEAAGGLVTVALPGGFPADLTTPDDYENGMLYHRVTVNNLPMAANDTQYRICLVQDAANRACSDGALQFNAAGAFEGNQLVSAMTVTGVMDWTAGLMSFELQATDTAGVPIDASETTWIGFPDYTLYYPLDVTYEAVLVSAGDVFQGYPSDNRVSAPVFSPGGGTYELQVDVAITSETPNAMIYYTTDGSDPTMASTLYDGTPVQITADTLLRARAFEMTLADSTVTEEQYTIVAQLTEGLRGRYYNGESFNNFVVTRTDPQIDFTWDGGVSPAPGVDSDVFSVIWTGQVTPAYTDTYTFTTTNDDGTRLWINNQLIIDDWFYHGPETRSGEISLQAGQQYSVWMEYFNGGGSGQSRLEWSSPQQPLEVIPNAALDPNLAMTDNPQIALFADDDEPEMFEISTEEPLRLELRRRLNLDDDVTVTLSYGGTAENGTDVQMLPLTVNFPAGELVRTIEVFPIDDTEIEGDETLTVTLESGNGYGVSEPTTVSIIIRDNDRAVSNISGEVIYTGTESGEIIVEAFRDTDQSFQARRETLLNPGAFELIDLEEGEYTVIAFVDSNGNEAIDEGEIWGIHQDENFEPLKVDVPPGADNIVINLDVAPGGPPPTDDGGCCATTRPQSNLLWFVFAMIFVFSFVRRKRLFPI